MLGLCRDAIACMHSRPNTGAIDICGAALILNSTELKLDFFVFFFRECLASLVHMHAYTPNSKGNDAVLCTALVNRLNM